ncbi:MAG: ATP-dependent DNA helicase RecG [Lachnospiraceae bacterium]|nr:ATP-dependent DNA helicase RecG [Lachnospiraceae bacterium]
MQLDHTVNQIKGVGEKSSTLFRKLGIENIRDLLLYFPNSYKRYEAPVFIEELEVGRRMAVKAQITSKPDFRRVRSLTLTTCFAKDVTGALKLVWFNMPYLRNTLHTGQTYVFVGDISMKGNTLTMEHPEFYKEEDYKALEKVLQPIYGLTKGLTSKSIGKAVRAVLPLVDDIPEPLPDEIIEKYDLMYYSDAIKLMHFPEDEELFMKARKRVIFDEFFFYLARMEKLKEGQLQVTNHYVINENDIKDSFISSLPYKLTAAQKRTVDEICEDMAGDLVMNRLVQGDVGSGKTIVAAISFLVCVKSGFQCAYMVPTEVLAGQHFEKLKKLLEPYGVRVSLLCGSTPAKEKRMIYEGLKAHDIDLVIGTHAIIQDKVEFKELALVVTDEQHRFGVKQREKLSKKGDMPHVLVMSATPIPRTLAIILYGDLDISVIDELPANRLPIKNCAVGVNYRPAAYKFITKEVAAGHQAYVICAMVDENDTLEVENVIGYTETLKEKLPPSVRIEYLHGKMSSEEKQSIMNRYYNREIDVLVSTTVIEVGIDNPNSTVMMIENAERFGLAQLHQLRGRVGRGDAQSYCVFMCGKESREAMDRLQVLVDSNDGFFIANEDLRLRGPGDFFGYRQSGDPYFKLADVYNHADVLRNAKRAVDEVKKRGMLEEVIASDLRGGSYTDINL